MFVTSSGQTRWVEMSMTSVYSRWVATVFTASLLAACGGSGGKTDARKDAPDGTDQLADGLILSNDRDGSPTQDASTPDAKPDDTPASGPDADGTPDKPVDRSPEVALDLAPDQTRDIISSWVDTACSANSRCSLADGGNGVCGTEGICTTCAGTDVDNTCIRGYGIGAICVGGQCAAAPCQDSASCTVLGNALCDTSTHTCRACKSDGECQSDPQYNVGGTPYCVSGRCAYRG
jgi:hypothetical protein